MAGLSESIGGPRVDGVDGGDVWQFQGELLVWYNIRTAKMSWLRSLGRLRVD